MGYPKCEYNREDAKSAKEDAKKKILIQYFLRVCLRALGVFVVQFIL